MSGKKHFVKVVLVALVVVSLLGANPVAAQNNATQNNIVCNGSGTDGQTSLGGLVASVVSLIVTVAALIAVVGGAGFTLASAAKPTSDYAERRNQTIIYGGGTVLVLYGANALITQIDSSLSFSCILPFA